jgi:hypothetical protein
MHRRWGSWSETIDHSTVIHSHTPSLRLTFSERAFLSASSRPTMLAMRPKQNERKKPPQTIVAMHLPEKTHFQTDLRYPISLPYCDRIACNPLHRQRVWYFCNKCPNELCTHYHHHLPNFLGDDVSENVAVSNGGHSCISPIHGRDVPECAPGPHSFIWLWAEINTIKR